MLPVFLSAGVARYCGVVKTPSVADEKSALMVRKARGIDLILAFTVDRAI